MNSLQHLTTELTAFDSWVAFAEAMDKGYVPTLRAWPGRSKSNKQRTALVEELRSRLVAMGYKVF